MEKVNNTTRSEQFQNLIKDSRLDTGIAINSGGVNLVVPA